MREASAKPRDNRLAASCGGMWAAVAVLRSVRDEQESDSDGDELESDSEGKIMMKPGGWVTSFSLWCHLSDGKQMWHIHMHRVIIF